MLYGLIATGRGVKSPERAQSLSKSKRVNAGGIHGSDACAAVHRMSRRTILADPTPRLEYQGHEHPTRWLCGPVSLPNRTREPVSCSARAFHPQQSPVAGRRALRDTAMVKAGIDLRWKPRAPILVCAAACFLIVAAQGVSVGVHTLGAPRCAGVGCDVVARSGKVQPRRRVVGRECPPGFVVSPDGQDCVPSCAEGSALSLATGECLAVSAVWCDDGYAYDDASGACVEQHCSGGRVPVANSDECVCPPGSVAVAGRDACVSLSPVLCDAGRVFDESTGACSCPTAVDPTTNLCIVCGEGMQWHHDTQQCGALLACNSAGVCHPVEEMLCLHDRIFNTESGRCECPTGFNDEGNCIHCDDGFEWHERLHQCVPDGSSPACNVHTGECFDVEDMGCKRGRVWNWETGQCDCPTAVVGPDKECVYCIDGQYWHERAQGCVADGDASFACNVVTNECYDLEDMVCHANRQWDPTSGTCICPTMIIPETGECLGCAEDEVWDSLNQVCQGNGLACDADGRCFPTEDVVCHVGRAFDPVSGRCDCIPGNDCDDGEHACDPHSGVCWPVRRVFCSSPNFVFDADLAQCVCPTIMDSAGNCAAPGEENTVCDPVSGECFTMEPMYCEERHVFDSVTNRCVCASGLVSDGSGGCYGVADLFCHSGHVWDEETGSCVIPVPQMLDIYCHDTFVWDAALLGCVCRGIVSSESGRCVDCPQHHSWNEEAFACVFDYATVNVFCEENFVWDADSSSCICAGVFVESIGACIPNCPEGQVMDASGACFPYRPVFCSGWHFWDATSASCVTDGDDCDSLSGECFTLSPVSCQPGMLFNEVEGRCYCPTAIDSAGVCHICQDGEVWDARVAACVGEICDELFVWDADAQSCVCAHYIDALSGRCVTWPPCVTGLLQDASGNCFESVDVFCPDFYVWDRATASCSCPNVLDPSTGSCSEFPACPGDQLQDEEGSCFCPPNFFVDVETQVCVCSHVLDASTGECSPCPAGHILGADGNCFAHVSVYCPDNFVWDHGLLSCVCPNVLDLEDGTCSQFPPCPANQIQGDDGSCFCPPNYVVEEATQACICPTVRHPLNGACSRCHEGQAEDRQGNCFRYAPGVCATNFAWDAESARCVCLNVFDEDSGTCSDYPACPGDQHRDQTGDCSCPPNYIVDADTQHCFCPNVLDSETNECSACPAGEAEDAQSNCHRFVDVFCPEYFVWDEATLSCSCPNVLNAETGACPEFPACPGNQLLDEEGSCYCLPNFVVDPGSQLCVCPNVLDIETGECSRYPACPGNQLQDEQGDCYCLPNFIVDDQSGDCVCPNVLDSDTGECSPCAAGQASDGQGGCFDYTAAVCAEFFVWNAATATCDCPNVYDPETNSCSPCPANALRNAQGSCHRFVEVFCPEHFVWDEVTLSCSCPNVLDAETGACPEFPACPGNQLQDEEGNCYCLPNFVVDPDSQLCVCPNVLDIETGECSRYPACPGNQLQDEQGDCYCLPNFIVDDRSGDCVCPNGLDSNTGECSPCAAGQASDGQGGCFDYTAAVCAEFFVWNAATATCDCPNVLDPETGLCSQFPACRSGQIQGIDGRCFVHVDTFCQDNFVWDESEQACTCPFVLHQPTGSCVSCDEGEIVDLNSGLCVRLLDTLCPEHFVYDGVSLSCVCPTVYDPLTGRCSQCVAGRVPDGADCVCAPGSLEDEGSGACVPLPVETHCPDGWEFVVETVACREIVECTGLFVRNTDTNVCECLPHLVEDGGACVCPVGERFNDDGATCQVDACVADNIVCHNGGTCRDLNDDDDAGWVCDCVPGWTGTRCRVEVDECDPNPCQNGGICIDLFNDFECNCRTPATGWEGPTCEVNHDDCSPDPCYGQGCVDELLGYTCQCSCPDETPCLRNGACFPRVGGSCSPGTEDCVEVNAESSDSSCAACPDGQFAVECVDSEPVCEICTECAYGEVSPCSDDEDTECSPQPTCSCGPESPCAWLGSCFPRINGVCSSATLDCHACNCPDSAPCVVGAECHAQVGGECPVGHDALCLDGRKAIPATDSSSDEGSEAQDGSDGSGSESAGGRDGFGDGALCDTPCPDGMYGPGFCIDGLPLCELCSSCPYGEDSPCTTTDNAVCSDPPLNSDGSVCGCPLSSPCSFAGTCFARNQGSCAPGTNDCYGCNCPAESPCFYQGFCSPTVGGHCSPGALWCADGVIGEGGFSDASESGSDTNDASTSTSGKNEDFESGSSAGSASTGASGEDDELSTCACPEEAPCSYNGACFARNHGSCSPGTTDCFGCDCPAASPCFFQGFCSPTVGSECSPGAFWCSGGDVGGGDDGTDSGGGSDLPTTAVFDGLADDQCRCGDPVPCMLADGTCVARDTSGECPTPSEDCGCSCPAEADCMFNGACFARHDGVCTSGTHHCVAGDEGPEDACYDCPAFAPCYVNGSCEAVGTDGQCSADARDCLCMCPAAAPCYFNGACSIKINGVCSAGTRDCTASNEDHVVGAPTIVVAATGSSSSSQSNIECGGCQGEPGPCRAPGGACVDFDDNGACPAGTAVCALVDVAAVTTPTTAPAGAKLVFGTVVIHGAPVASFSGVAETSLKATIAATAGAKGIRDVSILAITEEIRDTPGRRMTSTGVVIQFSVLLASQQSAAGAAVSLATVSRGVQAAKLGRVLSVAGLDVLDVEIREVSVSGGSGSSVRCADVSNLCQHNGVCVDLGEDDIVCACAAGYEGETCEIETYECAPNLCVHGTCVDDIAAFHCECDEGYTGSLCNVNINECMVADACSVPGAEACVDGIGEAQCVCRSGYAGPRCEIQVDDCADSPCNNGGTCIDLINEYQCICADGFVGDNCELTDSPCQLSPCTHGTCVDVGENNFACDCDAGWVGDTCNVVDATSDSGDASRADAFCASEPCDAIGAVSCANTSSGWACVCRAGYRGESCAEHVCDDEPCHNGGGCSVENGEAVCACADGFTGATCQHAVTTSACSFDSCAHNGLCLNDGESAQCVCPAGFTGARCEVDIDECQQGSSAPTDGEGGTHGPCQNGGNCLDLVGSFACECPAGTVGELCEVVVDECAPNPCAWGSTCVDEFNGFRCECPDGYGGHDCSVELRETPTSAQIGGQAVDPDTFDAAEDSSRISIGAIVGIAAAVLVVGIFARSVVKKRKTEANKVHVIDLSERDDATDDVQRSEVRSASGVDDVGPQPPSAPMQPWSIDETNIVVTEGMDSEKEDLARPTSAVGPECAASPCCPAMRGSGSGSVRPGTTPDATQTASAWSGGGSADRTPRSPAQGSATRASSAASMFRRAGNALFARTTSGRSSGSGKVSPFVSPASVQQQPPRRTRSGRGLVTPLPLHHSDDSSSSSSSDSSSDEGVLHVSRCDDDLDSEAPGPPVAATQAPGSLAGASAAGPVYSPRRTGGRAHEWSFLEGPGAIPDATEEENEVDVEPVLGAPARGLNGNKDDAEEICAAEAAEEKRESPRTTSPAAVAAERMENSRALLADLLSDGDSDGDDEVRPASLT